MSFIVKGVDLPKKAGELLAVNICDGFISVYTVTPKDTVIEHKAEAVQIPKYHGKIVDLDDLVVKYWDGNFMEIDNEAYDNAVVILEAEE